MESINSSAIYDFHHIIRRHGQFFDKGQSTELLFEK